MSDPHPSSGTAGLCCCRKLLPVPGRPGAKAARARRPHPGSARCPLVDVATASNFQSFQLDHFHLDLRLNFTLKEMTGWQVLDLVPIQPGVDTLVLDTHPSLLIYSIDCKTPGSAQPDGPVSLTFRVDPFTDYGSSLNVSLPGAVVRRGKGFQITAQPLVFTLGHSVSNRSFFPCFDTPAVKSTYSATVRVPEGVMVLMSATRSSYSKPDRVFHFSMQYPVPAYLVALVAGELQHVDLGPRSRVWAEPCLLSCVLNKLGGSVDRWLAIAEDLFGPYPWGRCDIVFLPPSFPIVAMENPCLTFIIASILESQEFLLIDIIHEISHGWFGNAVTNATWEDMWLSEGLATYAQRRITTLACEAFTCLETEFRLDALHRQLRLLGADSPVSKLQVKFEPGVNPSTLMNLFTYEKGFCFASYLSRLCGDVTRFDAFLRTYISQFKFSSVVAEDLIELFLDYFPELKEEGVAHREGLEFDRWLCGVGAPLCEPDLSAGSVLTRPVHRLCDLWAKDAPDPDALATFDLSTWSSFQTVLFLDRMLDRCPLPHVRRSNYHPEIPAVRSFLHKHTSRMYTVPLYEDLVAGVMQSIAMEIYYQTQGRLHPNLRRTLMQIIFETPDPASSPPSDPAPCPHSNPASSSPNPSPCPHSNSASSSNPTISPPLNPSTSSPVSPLTNPSLLTPPPETNTSSSFLSPPPLQTNSSLPTPLSTNTSTSSCPSPPPPPSTTAALILWKVDVSA
ncbi:hypothetical protein NHX12_008416 [Muraenolepis orangiensis]|uniref:Peptidase M1 leukotriene A4 hydrolase/aminopeptidase C-terminal domain-containing protein n=1 Tax=Muraenolepis orangiensis TaxID=630683 RepID=A0A9Q0DNT2_9TELE|nr:hypothetical protein NHX12_008416 [Muraenolepis orangiensis]